MTFAVVRIGLGLWGLAVPKLAAGNFTILTGILTGFLVAKGMIGLIRAPRNKAKSLDELEADLRTI